MGVALEFAGLTPIDSQSKGAETTMPGRRVITGPSTGPILGSRRGACGQVSWIHGVGLSQLAMVTLQGQLW
jgi:hypothetical protein